MSDDFRGGSINIDRLSKFLQKHTQQYISAILYGIKHYEQNKQGLGNVMSTDRLPYKRISAPGI